MKQTTATLTFLALLAVVSSSAQAGWSDFLDKITAPDKKSGPTSDASTSSAAAMALSPTELSGGLKEALDKGVQHAVQWLGREDGFLSNPKVRIPVPDSLGWAEKGLRTIGQGQLIDDFELSLNRAAEKAMPMVTGTFQQSIRAMTLEDARGILQGPDDAATQYFRRQNEATLLEQIRPIVSETTQQAGVTQQYKAVIDKAGVMGSLIPGDAADLDGYVTQRALDGLFLTIAEEEKRIRQDPVARTTDLLRKVFSNIGG